MGTCDVMVWRIADEDGVARRNLREPQRFPEDGGIWFPGAELLRDDDEIDQVFDPEKGDFAALDIGWAVRHQTNTTIQATERFDRRSGIGKECQAMIVILLKPGHRPVRDICIGNSMPSKELGEVIGAMQLHGQRVGHHLVEISSRRLGIIANGRKIARKRESQAKIPSGGVVAQGIVQVEQHRARQRQQGRDCRLIHHVSVGR